MVAREVELGHITPEEAEKDYRRSVLLQCVGASDQVYPDMFFGTTRLNAVYMLCSDGFRHEITECDIRIIYDVLETPNGDQHFISQLVFYDSDECLLSPSMNFYDDSYITFRINECEMVQSLIGFA